MKYEHIPSSMFHHNIFDHGITSVHGLLRVFDATVFKEKPVLTETNETEDSHPPSGNPYSHDR